MDDQPVRTSDTGNPMDEHERHWLSAYRKTGTYPAETQGGKWMLLIDEDKVNDDWKIIRVAVEDGKLGETAKVATARPNPHAINDKLKLICIYTYDWEDRDDVLRILQSLRDLGFSQSMTYKTNQATSEGKYSFNTAGPVSVYYAPEGMVELRVPKGGAQRSSRKPRESALFARKVKDLEQLEETLQEGDFYSSAYFQEIMNRDD